MQSALFNVVYELARWLGYNRVVVGNQYVGEKVVERFNKEVAYE